MGIAKRPVARHVFGSVVVQDKDLVDQAGALRHALGAVPRRLILKLPAHKGGRHGGRFYLLPLGRCRPYTPSLFFRPQRLT